MEVAGRVGWRVAGAAMWLDLGCMARCHMGVVVGICMNLSLTGSYSITSCRSSRTVDSVANFYNTQTYRQYREEV